MRHPSHLSAAIALGQALLAGSATGLRTVVVSLALVAAGAALAASRKVLQLVTVLVAAAAAIGNVALLVLVFCSLFAAAWLAGGGG